MGYIAHDAVVAVIPDWRGETLASIERFRDEMPEDYRRFLVGPIVGINGYTSYAFLPDGSKEGWEPSDTAERLRAQFYARAHGDAVHIRFGGDYGSEIGTTIIATTDPKVRALEAGAGQEEAR